MRAVQLTGPGGVDRLVLAEVPVPVAGPDHVVVRVHACGVAYRDVIERQRELPGMRYPIIQGHEFAGDIVEVGAGVTEWQIGDRVLNLYAASCGTCPACKAGQPRLCRNVPEAYGLTADGGYAEFAAVHRSALVRLDEGIDWIVAATLMSAVGVGYNNVVHKARIQPGETVLVTGASGGVGAAAVQTARWLGAEVYAVTGREEKRASLLALGAQTVLVDDGQSFHKKLRQLLPQGVDAVIDCVGSPTINAGLRSLRPYGRLVAIGNIDPAPLSLNVGLLVVNGLDLLGSDNVTSKALREVMQLTRDGVLSPNIDRVMGLSEAAAAQTLLEERAVVGRVVLTMDQTPG